MKLFVRWALLAGSILIAGYITGFLGLGFEVHVASTSDAINLFIGAAILGLVNATLGNILRFLTLPLTCLTLGLFGLVVNAVVLIIAAWFQFGFRFTSEGGSKFLAAVIAAALIALVNSALTRLLLPEGERDR